MLTRTTKALAGRGGWIWATAAGGLLVASSAQAHFVLQSPPSSMSQDFLGSPQKLGPCGDEGGGTPTGTVTAFQSGQTITVTINEIITHPGHYRIALAQNDRSELPPEPVVTPGSTPCGSAPVQNPPVFPVLADGVFEHTSSFSGPQSVNITLPSNVTCTHCTLQVLEFMAEHPLNNPGGCYYHHCADISIQGGEADAGPTADAGTSGSTGSRSAGSGCAAPGAAGVGGFLALAVWARRRAAILRDQ
jgi:hypothetical protein